MTDVWRISKELDLVDGNGRMSVVLHTDDGVHTVDLTQHQALALRSATGEWILRTLSSRTLPLSAERVD